MKKKLITFLSISCLLTMIVGCGQSSENSKAQDESQASSIQNEATDEQSASTVQILEDNVKVVSEETDDTPSNGSNVLVVYFSRTGEQYSVGVIEKGNTEIVADMIMEKTGADVFEILPEEDYYPYTYDELTDIAKQELNDNARPAYAGDVPDLSQYDTIFIGAPVWWGDWPMIMYTFFEENADGLAGKTLIPFSTHAGSGLSGFDKKLSASCPDSTVGTGLAIAGTDAQNNKDKVRNNVNEWLTELDLYGTAVLLEEVGKVIAEGGAGVTISSQSGWRMPQLSPEEDRALATTPTEELLNLEILKPENIKDTLHAYQMAKRCNEKRVMYECVKWGERGARLNDIAPGIIVTPLAIDEFNGPRGDFYKNMFAKCPAGRPGTADEMANIAELLMSDAGAFITGSTFLADGGATASYYYGPLQPDKQ